MQSIINILLIAEEAPEFYTRVLQAFIPTKPLELLSEPSISLLPTGNFLLDREDQPTFSRLSEAIKARNEMID